VKLGSPGRVKIGLVVAKGPAGSGSGGFSGVVRRRGVRRRLQGPSQENNIIRWGGVGGCK